LCFDIDYAKLDSAATIRDSVSQVLQVVSAVAWTRGWKQPCKRFVLALPVIVPVAARVWRKNTHAPVQRVCQDCETFCWQATDPCDSAPRYITVILSRGDLYFGKPPTVATVHHVTGVSVKRLCSESESSSFFRSIVPRQSRPFLLHKAAVAKPGQTMQEIRRQPLG